MASWASASFTLLASRLTVAAMSVSGTSDCTLATVIFWSGAVTSAGTRLVNTMRPLAPVSAPAGLLKPTSVRSSVPPPVISSEPSTQPTCPTNRARPVTGEAIGAAIGDSAAGCSPPCSNVSWPVSKLIVPDLVARVCTRCPVPSLRPCRSVAARSAVQSPARETAVPEISTGLNRVIAATSVTCAVSIVASAFRSRSLPARSNTPAPSAIFASRNGALTAIFPARARTRQAPPFSVRIGSLVGQSSPETVSTSFSPISSRATVTGEHLSAAKLITSLASENRPLVLRSASISGPSEPLAARLATVAVTAPLGATV